MIAEIVAVGSELLDPFHQDTNSLYLTGKLNQIGVEVAFKSVVGDNRRHLTEVARTAICRADIVIFMGGLGPTEDDLTRESVAAAMGREVHRDPVLITELYTRFAQYRRHMPENNERQAELIDGAEVLRNSRGTAPGQWIDAQIDGRPRYIMLLPGPPHEIKPMFDEQCLPRLSTKVPKEFMATRHLRIAMIGESDCDSRIAPIYKAAQDVETTILAGAGEINLHLRTRDADQETAEARVEELAGKIEDELGDFVYSRGESLEEIVGYHLQLRNATLAVAESCTGGLLGKRITNVSGSSRYFLGGAIVYSNDFKTLFANVPPLMIAEHGAVSPEVAKALAEGIRDETGASIGVSVTGIAGPQGGTEAKPVGLVYHALSDAKGTEVVERRFPGDRERIRLFASQQALDMIRRRLMKA
ncbi:MAG TPA: competence/damage-inducible protein A [Terriglobales bacterium]|nr:competence/damage-inducible protein A [Terriglobales bacterium]